MIETIAATYLALATLGYLALLHRLPKDYKRASGYVQRRLMTLRIVQGYRRCVSAVMSVSGYEETLKRLRVF